MHLIKWKARRAGGRITVTGKTSDGTDAKIVGVDYVEPGEAPGPAHCVAKDKHGEMHTLGMI